MDVQPCEQKDAIQEIKTDVAILKASDERNTSVLERVEGKVDKILYFILGVGITAIGGLLAIVSKVWW